MIDRYRGISPQGDLLLIEKLAERLRNKSILNINSTRSGGGVAEILSRAVPLMKDLGIDARWEIITGDETFFDVTKKIHNAIQGMPQEITPEMWDYYVEVNRKNASVLQDDADATMIHDPQPLPLADYRKSPVWIWRCHIDVSSPAGRICELLERFCRKYDGAIFSASKFTRQLGLSEFIVSPSIDPLSEKNRELEQEEIDRVLDVFRLPPDRPMVLQVSRFDRFKDPVGVIRAYRMVKKYNDCFLVLAGSPATDDPEGKTVLEEVRRFADDDPDIHVLLLSAGSDLEINALQRSATVVLQKSTREGFGLTVSEALWKGKPVIGGAVGGIPLQVVDGFSGFLVHSPEGAAFRIRQMLNNSTMASEMGKRGREYVRTNFLITRQIRDYLSIWYALENDGRKLFEL